MMQVHAFGTIDLTSRGHRQEVNGQYFAVSKRGTAAEATTNTPGERKSGLCSNDVLEENSEHMAQ